MSFLKKIIQSTADVLIPRTCSVCHTVLACDESYICHTCMSGMPFTRYDGGRFSSMDERFAGKVLIQRTYGYFFYRKGDKYCNIIHDIKYHNLPSMGKWLGRIAAHEAAKWHFFDGIDAIIPVPMHSTKLAKRGYNQAERIAKGVSEATSIPLLRNIISTQTHATQTRKHREERWQSAEGIFSINKAEDLQHKHILLVDDVVTTGATLTNCAKCLSGIEGIAISIFTLAVADNEI